MSIRKLRSGRVPTATALDYVGEAGTIFWDETIGRLKLSDGETPGGSPLPIYVAAPGIVGGIKPGPGVIISNDGTLVIDSTGLTFNFGDFIASINEGPSDGAILSSKNANQDISIVSNGTGTVNVVGDFHIHKTDSTLEGALTSTPVFAVDRTGVTTILVPNTVTTSGGVEIVGNDLGVFQTPLNTGVMLHVTGNDPDGVASPSRIYNDAIAGYSGWIGRRYNGTSAIPAAVQSNDEVMRLGANAYRSGGFNAVGGSNIRFVSTDNQSALTQGMKIDFYSTPQGQPLSSIVKVMTVEGGVGVTATKFLGPLTGDVTGNITGTAPAGTLTGTTLASNVVTSSLTSVGTLTTLTVAGGGTNNGLTVQGNIRYDVAYGNATVVQTGTKASTVICNGRTGQITTTASSIAKGAAVTFTVTNSYITAVTDVPIVAIQSGATIDSYAICVSRVQVGSFNITITNNGTGALTDTLVINFAVIKVS